MEQLALKLSGLRLLELGVLGLWEAGSMLVHAEEGAGWKHIRGPLTTYIDPDYPKNCY